MNLFGFLKLDKSKKRKRRTRVQKHKKERISTRKYRRNKKGG